MTVLLCGCASPPDRFIDGVNYVTDKQHVADAHVQRVDGWPCMRTDDALRERLDAAFAAEDVEESRSLALLFVTRAHDLSETTVMNELDRLDAEGWSELKQRYFPNRTITDGAVREEFLARTEVQVSIVRDRILAATTTADVHAVLAPIRDGIETPAKQQGRFARMAPWILFTVPSRIAIDTIYDNEYRGNADVPFSRASVHEPLAMASTWATEYEQQLRRHAPIIVQEEAADPDYEPQIDQFGRVVARTPERIEVETEHPTVYAYGREIWIRDVPHVQLTYTYWYPEHPPLKRNDPEAGHLEGLTFRVTLDSEGRPAIFETLYNCGCHHHLYPAARVEQAAAQEYGRPVPGRALSIERHVQGRKDLIVSNVVPVGDGHPVLRTRAGWHGIVDVGYAVEKYPGEEHGAGRYELRPYDELEHLVAPDGRVTSMFHDNGLVKGATRGEGVFFTPAGLLSAGQPRQRGTQLIQWDDWDFDDPDLFVDALRLPSDF